MRILLRWALLVLSTPVLLTSPAVPSSVWIQAEGPAASPIQHGARVLQEKLLTLGYKVNTGDRSDSTVVRVLLAEWGSDEVQAWRRKLIRAVPNRPESFLVLPLPQERTVLVLGSDAVGTMYGAYNVAEQAAHARVPGDLTRIVKARVDSPFVELRGVNIFLQTDALEDLASWYHSERFWEKYLDFLSWCRFNFLDVHGMYGIYNTDFPNAFTYLVKSKSYPQVGCSAAKAARNLQMFKRIVALARERGIRVGFMNYNASAHVGQPPPGKNRRWPRRWGKPLSGKDLVRYTREVTQELVRQVPDLWIFGFRIGESGKDVDFYRNTYLAALRDAGRTDMRIYTRSWLTTKERVTTLAEDVVSPFYVEVKYNGEQLGPPYHAILDPRPWPWNPSYSYEAYSDRPQNYRIIWQVRANGTHRIFHWGDPDFVRRAVRTFPFAGAAGFSLEPMQAYYPWNDFYHNTARVDHAFFTWGYQRDWLWNLLWGRLSYNPNEAAQVWISEFVHRFGKGGPEVFEVERWASKVVPLVYAYHCLGPDHRHDAPELETGNQAFGYHNVRVEGGLESFISVKPLDRSVYQSIEEYVSNQLANKSDGRHTPPEVASRLEYIAAKIDEHLARAVVNVERGEQEFDCIRLDALALRELALYYAEKIHAATDYGFFRRTADFRFLEQARQKLRQASNHWDELVHITSTHYRPFVDQLRMRTNEFTWALETPRIQADLRELEAAIVNLRHRVWTYVGPPQLGHVPVFRWRRGQAVPISFTALMHGIDEKHSPKKRHAWLFYRRSGERWRKVALKSTAGKYQYYGSIPAEAVHGKSVDYYLELHYGEEVVREPKDAPKHVHTIDLSADWHDPVVMFSPPQPVIPVDRITLRIRVEDDSPLKRVDVVYKKLPSTAVWHRKGMKQVGPGTYQATVPLDHHGLLYHFEVVDTHGNGVVFPEVWEQTPYYVIESWDPRTARR